MMGQTEYLHPGGQHGGAGQAGYSLVQVTVTASNGPVDGFDDVQGQGLHGAVAGALYHEPCDLIAVELAVSILAVPDDLWDLAQTPADGGGLADARYTEDGAAVRGGGHGELRQGRAVPLVDGVNPADAVNGGAGGVGALHGAEKGVVNHGHVIQGDEHGGEGVETPPAVRRFELGGVRRRGRTGKAAEQGLFGQHLRHGLQERVGLCAAELIGCVDGIHCRLVWIFHWCFLLSWVRWALMSAPL